MTKWSEMTSAEKDAWHARVRALTPEQRAAWYDSMLPKTNGKSPPVKPTPITPVKPIAPAPAVLSPSPRSTPGSWCFGRTREEIETEFERLRTAAVDAETDRDVARMTGRPVIHYERVEGWEDCERVEALIQSIAGRSLDDDDEFEALLASIRPGADDRPRGPAGPDDQNRMDPSRPGFPKKGKPPTPTTTPPPKSPTPAPKQTPRPKSDDEEADEFVKSLPKMRRIGQGGRLNGWQVSFSQE